MDIDSVLAQARQQANAKMAPKEEKIQVFTKQEMEQPAKEEVKPATQEQVAAEESETKPFSSMFDFDKIVDNAIQSNGYAEMEDDTYNANIDSIQLKTLDSGYKLFNISYTLFLDGGKETKKETDSVFLTKSFPEITEDETQKINISISRISYLIQQISGLNKEETKIIVSTFFKEWFESKREDKSFDNALFKNKSGTLQIKSKPSKDGSRVFTTKTFKVGKRVQDMPTKDSGLVL